jgi:hypothetical protein
MITGLSKVDIPKFLNLIWLYFKERRHFLGPISLLLLAFHNNPATDPGVPMLLLPSASLESPLLLWSLLLLAFLLLSTSLSE